MSLKNEKKKIGLFQKLKNSLEKKFNLTKKTKSDKKKPSHNFLVEASQDLKSHNTGVISSENLFETQQNAVNKEEMTKCTLAKDISVAANSNEMETSTPISVRKNISFISKSSLSSIEDIPIKLYTNSNLRKSANYEASDQDIYMESFPSNNTYTEDDEAEEDKNIVRPIFIYLGITEVDPEQYRQSYNSELLEPHELQLYLQAIQPPEDNI